MNKSDLTHLIEMLSRHLDSVSAHYKVEDIELCLLSCPTDISALSLVQTYLYLGVEANAFRSNYQSIVSENKSFIAHIKKDDEEHFVFVQTATEDLVVYYEGNKKIKITPTEFQKEWTGIVIIANKTAQNEEYNSYNNHHKHTPYILLLSIILLFGYINSSILSVCTIILDVIGSIFCVGIIKTQIPRYSLFDKFCIVNSRFDCDKLDLGRYVSVLSKKNLALIGFSYFCYRIFITLFSVGEYMNITCITNLIALFASVISICSIIYQFVVRRFCLLCLSVMGILLVEGVIAYYNYNTTFSLSNNIWMIMVLSVLLSGVCAWFLEYSLKCKEELSSRRINELKIKRTQGVIRALFASPFLINDGDESFCIGDKNTPITITTYISPWCSKCKKVAIQMIRLISIYPKFINWRIYIDSINIEQFEKVNNVQLCLGKGMTSNMSERDKLYLLKEWYQKQSERKLNEKTNRLTSSIEYVKGLLIKQIDFVKGEKQVPKVWINGRVFPDNYSLDDLPFIILELSMINSQKQ